VSPDRSATLVVLRVPRIGDTTGSNHEMSKSRECLGSGFSRFGGYQEKVCVDRLLMMINAVATRLLPMAKARGIRR